MKFPIGPEVTTSFFYISLLDLLKLVMAVVPSDPHGCICVAVRRPSVASHVLLA